MAKATSKAATTGEAHETKDGKPSVVKDQAHATPANAPVNDTAIVDQQHAGTAPAGSNDDAAMLPVDPSGRGPDGINSTDTSRATDDAGAGDTAGPAGVDLDPRQFPLLTAAFRQLSQSAMFDAFGKVMLRVTAKQDGFRRGGIEHAGTADHELVRFSPEQVEAMLAEPLLHVELVSVSRD